MERDVQDIVGIGVGPANLSLAALLAGAPHACTAGLKISFFDKGDRFNWHPGQLLPMSRMQTSIVRDLVSLADPTSRFSFLSFLKAHRRLLQFLNTGHWFATREEFSAYMAWVASQLSSLFFTRKVGKISFDRDQNLFEVEVEGIGGHERVRAKHVVLGTGYRPARVCATPYGGTYCHASDLLKGDRGYGGRTVAVLGGGQSAGETVQHLLESPHLPACLIWLTRSWTLPPLNTGNFARELFTPAFARHHFGYKQSARESVAAATHTVETGISPGLLEHVYQLLYYHKHVTGGGMEIRVQPGVSVESVKPVGNGFSVSCTRLRDGGLERHDVDDVISCIGFAEPQLPPFVVDGALVILELLKGVRRDYSVDWGGPGDRKMFVQSMAITTHGVSDRHFSMIAHRNMAIINSIIGEPAYVIDDDDAIASW